MRKSVQVRAAVAWALVQKDSKEAGGRADIEAAQLRTGAEPGERPAAHTWAPSQEAGEDALPTGMPASRDPEARASALSFLPLPLSPPQVSTLG